MKVGTFAKDFEDWRNTTVTISPFTSYDKFGTPSYGTGVATLCYIEMHPKLIQNTTGQEVVSQARVYVIGNSAYTVRDKLVLPDSKYPPVLRIDQFYNEVGTLELSVFFI
jgi:hypothetical protein